MAADGSTAFSLLPFALTLRLSRETTATWENSAPAGFQHLVQPQTWLKAHCPVTLTVTAFCLHLQTSVPPANSFAPGFTPWSTAGWIEILLAICSPFPVCWN